MQSVKKVQEEPINKEIRLPLHFWNDSVRSLYPILPRSTVLVVGDWDFGYSKSLLQLFGHQISLVATVYDSEKTVLEKYATASENIAFLQDFPNCTIMYDVDCGKLHKLLKGQQFSRIIFNFPHVGKGIKDQDKNVAANQRLLRAYFENCKPLLKVASSKNSLSYNTNFITINEDELTSEHIATLEFKNNQDNDSHDEMPEIHVTMKVGDPYDLWDIKQVAWKCGLKCKESFDFYFEKYAGYFHRKTSGDRRESNDEDGEQNEIVEGKRCKTFVFIPR